MKMKSIVISRFGGPQVLHVAERDLPEPGRGEVRIRVRAAGVSFADVLMREGVYPRWERPPVLPFTPGWDVIGTVDALGDGVDGLALGQRVVALSKVGGYAEAICLHALDLVPVPDGLDDAEAVSLVLNYVTAYQMLHRIAAVKPKDRLLVDGAAGGVGSALIELAQLAKAEVYGTASAAKHEFVRSLGAHPIDYRVEEPAAVVRREAGRGVDVAFDGIGGWHLVRTLRATRPGGRVVPFGVSSLIPRDRVKTMREYLGMAAALALALLGSRRLTPYSISRMRKRHPLWFREDLASLLQMLATGAIRPTVAARLRLEQAARAHELLGRGDVRGRIILICG